MANQAKRRKLHKDIEALNAGQTGRQDNPFSKAAKGLTARERAKLSIMSMDPEERRKLGEAQGKYGSAVADSVRGSHAIWRKGRSGDKKRGTEKRYI